ncbi:MAG TPA: hypothetical protein PK878_05525 [bacterium]|nr:hypothetical protein [bacterium]
MWAGDLQLGEVKETSVGLLFLLYAIHFVTLFQTRYQSDESNSQSPA